MKLKTIIIFFAIVFVFQIAVFGQTNEVLIANARTAIEKQDLVSALQTIETVLKSEPKNDNALAEKARILYFQKKNAESLAVVEKVLLLNPKNYVVLNLRGIIKNSNNDFAGAVADYTSAIAANPNFAKAYVNRAKSNAKLKASQTKVFDDFIKARELEPKSATILQELIIYCLFSSDQKCGWEVEELVRLRPDADAYYLRGLQALMKGFEKARLGDDFWAEKAKLAVADVEKAVELNKNIINSGRFYQYAGRIYSHAKDYSVALDYFSKQIALDDKGGVKNAAIYVLRSEIYMFQGDYDSAMKDFDAIEKINPKVPQTYLGRGEIYLQKKDYENALIQFKKAVEVYPSGTSFTNLALVYSRKKDFSNAETNFNQASKDYPKNSWIRTYEIPPYCKKLTVEAEIALNNGNKDKAEDLFYQASNGKHDTDAKCIAYAAYQQGESQLAKRPLSAIDAYQRVVNADPSGYPDAQAKLDRAKGIDSRNVQPSPNSQKPANRNQGKIDELDRFKEALSEHRVMSKQWNSHVIAYDDLRKKITVDNVNNNSLVSKIYLEMKTELDTVIRLQSEYLTNYESVVLNYGKTDSNPLITKFVNEIIRLRNGLNDLKKTAAELGKEASDPFAELDAKDKKIRETAEVLAKVYEEFFAREDTFNKLIEKTKKAATLEDKNAIILQMKVEAEAIVKISDEFLSKYENKLEKTGVPRRDADIDELNKQIAGLRVQMEHYKETLAKIESLFKD